MGTLSRMVRRRVVKLLTKFYDPLITISIGKCSIEVPLSHSLKENLEVHPYINDNLGRLVKYTSATYPNLKVIDIGANVGDSVAFIRNHSDAPILCIDGDKRFFSILEKNAKGFKNVATCLSLVGQETGVTSFELKTREGTAYMVESTSANPIASLSDILDRYPDYKESKFLKIDTDGFDNLILRGSKAYLSRVQPIVFFEFDPYLSTKNGDDPFTFFTYMRGIGYQYAIFYMSNGEYLLSCDLSDERLVNEMIHFFSGRNIELYTDVCLLPAGDKELFRAICKIEIAFFKTARHY